MPVVVSTLFSTISSINLGVNNFYRDFLKPVIK